MAKINIQTRPGALFELLKKKVMTQQDAKDKTGVDRKTLLKINRGGPVKLEKLQQVANKLGVPEEYLRQPQAEEVTDDGDVPEPGTIMLRKLDAERLEELLAGAKRVKWHLNAKVRDDEARKFLEDFETAVEQLLEDGPSLETLSLRLQLERLKTADDIAARVERLAEHRLALLGADHLFWECKYTGHGYGPDISWFKEDYRSFNTVLLSVEPFGTHSRRAHISIGEPPPLFAHGPETDVFVNGVQLPSLEEL